VRWSRRTSTRGSEFVSSGGQFRVSLDTACRCTSERSSGRGASAGIRWRPLTCRG
jgi:hypothetical protein